VADIVHRIGIKAPADKVYRALATPQGVASWWSRETAGGSKVGEDLVFTFSEDDGSVKGEMRAQIATLDPGKRVAWTITTGPEEWVGTDISFDLSKGEDGMTIVLFAHRKWPEQKDFMAHCSMKWATFLLSLRQLVETGKGKPAPDDLKIDDWN